MKKVYENLTKENINKNLFDVDFEFEDLTKIEKQLLKDLVQKITDDVMEFELMSVEKVAQPLDILIKLKNNKTTGDVIIKMKDKGDHTLGVFKFKTFKITEINNLIDFDFGEADWKNCSKNLSIIFTYDDILYSADGKEYEKLT